VTLLERDESPEEMGEVGLCDVRGGDCCGYEDGFGGSGGMISVGGIVVLAVMVVGVWRKVEQKVLAALETLLPGCQKTSKSVVHLLTSRKGPGARY